MSIEQLTQICTQAMEDKCLAGDNRYRTRLKSELREIKGKNEVGYYLDMLKLRDEGMYYEQNENNLLVPYLLGVVDEVRIDEEVVSDFGDFPDVDIDFLPEVRDYLKNKWAIEQFGQPYVCSIGSYNTFGMKTALKDMARVLNKPGQEINDITTSLEAKDDEGKELTWQKALDLYPDLKEYCEANPDVADAARRLLHRNKSMGKHAGGLIISSKPLDRLIPLVLSKDGQVTSAWVEGLHGQDLGPMGLIKFDLLVITNILQIAYACKLIKERHGLKAISGMTDERGTVIGKDWTDLSYLDDPRAIHMGNEADLKCIFQFDSPGIRGLVGRGGVANFEELVAYTALYRPGPLGMKMHEAFVNRKQGKEEYERHHVLEDILADTYYIMAYQEQILSMLNLVGKIPLDICEIIRKAISKKKEKEFQPYKEQYIEQGRETLGFSEEKMKQQWAAIESFSAYGFNRSMLKGTQVLTSTYDEKAIEDFVPGDRVLSVNEAGETVETEVLAVHDHGVLDAYEITLDDGYKIVCSMNHKFLTEHGQMPLWKIIETNSSILCDLSDRIQRSDYAEEERSGVDGEMRPAVPNGQGDACPHEGLCGV